MKDENNRVLQFSPPPPKKPTLLNSNSIWNARTRLNEVIGAPKCFVGTKQITIFLKNNHSKHEKKVEITQKIQKEARNDQTLSRRFKWIAILFFFFGKLVCLNSF